MKKKICLVVLSLSMLAIGYLMPITTTQAQDNSGEGPPQCACMYPSQNGNEYGVLVPNEPPVDGSKFTCVVKKCYLLVE